MPTDSQIIKALYDMVAQSQKQAAEDSKTISLIRKEHVRMMDKTDQLLAAFNNLSSKVVAMEKLLKK